MTGLIKFSMVINNNYYFSAYYYSRRIRIWKTTL